MIVRDHRVPSLYEDKMPLWYDRANFNENIKPISDLQKMCNNKDECILVGYSMLPYA